MRAGLGDGAFPRREDVEGGMKKMRGGWRRLPLSAHLTGQAIVQGCLLWLNESGQGRAVRIRAKYCQSGAVPS